MCCCKIHLHARWAIKSLLSNVKKQNIEVDFNDYSSFFDHLTKQCPTVNNNDKYLNWNCTHNNTFMCNDITRTWNTFKDKILKSSNPNITSKFMYFDKIEKLSKKGKVYKALQPINVDATLPFLIQFIDKMLPKIIHHRNQLKNFRSNVNSVTKHFDNAVLIDIDFSENLDVKTFKEPQSSHWTSHQLSVHSGILRYKGKKTYHQYFSDDINHDQSFVKIAISEMLETIELPNDATIIIDSDNTSLHRIFMICRC